MFIKRLGKCVQRKVESAVRVCAYFGMFILAAMMFIGTADVAGRFFLNSPIEGAYELIGFLLLCLAAGSFGFSQLRKENLRISIVTKSLPVKTREIFEIVVHLIGFILSSLITWRMLVLAQRYISLGRKGLSPELDIPFAPFIIILSVGFLLMTVVFMIDVVHSINKAVKQ